MTVLTGRVMGIARPVGGSAGGWWAPTIGALWVAINVLLVAAGTQAYPKGCSFAAGIINGAMLSVIAVSRASQRFQAGTTGLLGGLTLSGLRSDGSMIWKATELLHGTVDRILHYLGISGDQYHQAIEMESLYIIWTTIVVVLASLVAEWVRQAWDER